jgi:hypothetical protein
MSRDLHALLVDVLNGDAMSPAILVKMDFDAAPVFLWTGTGDLAWDGDTYTGAGDLLGFEFPEENNSGAVSGLTFTLSGAESTWVSVALSQTYKGRKAEMFLAEVTHAPNAVVGAPVRLFKGVMDTMFSDDDGAEATISVTVERYSIDPTASGFLWDNEEQQRRFPGDKGLEYVPSMAEAELDWGVPNSAAQQKAPSNPGTTTQPPLGGAGRTNRKPSAPYTGSTGGTSGAGRTNRQGQNTGAASDTGGSVNQRGRYGRG